MMMGNELADPDLYALGDPWNVWRKLRGSEPVSWTHEVDGPGFWSVVDFETGTRVLQDWHAFSSEPGTTLEGNRWENDPAAGQMLPLLDPPAHDKLSRAISPAFAPQRLAEVKASCADYLSTLLDQCTEQGRFEIGDAIGSPLAAQTSFRMLGIPVSDEHYLLPIIRDTLSCNSTERALADAELLMYLADMVKDRRRRPGHDLLSTLATTDVGGGQLDEQAVLLSFTNILSAGLTTTRLAINGGVHAFTSHPEQWHGLRCEPSLVSSAVEEVLRWTSPALAVVRTARQAAVLCGQGIRSQDRIAVWLPSLNRDESVFLNPDSFLIDRSPNRHVAMGTGPHACLGMAVARMELNLLLCAICRRWKTVLQDGPIRRMHSLVLHGVDEMTVQVESA